ncbi:hypothetical protein K1719_013016 [Acacia pycnantha]|nr:hypothetical protein K1719_013016 [Acacia pycnantha]
MIVLHSARNFSSLETAILGTCILYNQDSAPSKVQAALREFSTSSAILYVVQLRLNVHGDLRLQGLKLVGCWLLW